MDFNNGLYVFNGVPGLDASKGERVAKALQKLQAKIKQLEQVREMERETSLKNGPAGNDQDNITIADVRFKLLYLQLRYMRALLRKNKDGLHNSENDIAEIPEIPPEDNIDENCCKETQTGTSLIQTPNENTSDAFQVSFPLRDANTVTDTDHVPSEIIPPSTSDAPMHYHLNFEDVPFILGSSTSDSHNLLANVQNVLAKMKTHNKLLCGQRCHASRQRKNPPTNRQPSQDCASATAGRKHSQDGEASTSAEKCTSHDYASTSAEKQSSQDTNKMMQDLSQQLMELQIKQAKLMETIDSTEGLHMAERLKSKPDESEFHRKQKFSNTDTIVNVRPKDKQQKPNRITKREKHVVPINKIQANLPQVARQRLLRSIREVKTHLSEDDISWI